MCGTPVESEGGVRSVMPKTLFSSAGANTLITCAPDFLWWYRMAWTPYSSMVERSITS